MKFPPTCKTCKTRNGQNVTLLARHPDPKSVYPLYGVIEGSSCWFYWTDRGHHMAGGNSSPLDLILPFQLEVGQTYVDQNDGVEWTVVYHNAERGLFLAVDDHLGTYWFYPEGRSIGGTLQLDRVDPK